MAGVLANDEHLAMASDDFALVAHFLDRRAYLHNCFLSVMRSYIYLSRPAADDDFPHCLPNRMPDRPAPLPTHYAPTPVETFRRSSFSSQNLHTASTRRADTALFEPIGDATSIEIVDGKLDRHFVTRQDLDVVHAHLAGNVGQYLVPVFEFHPKHSVWQRLEDRSLELDDIFFGQKCSFKQMVVKQQLQMIPNY